MAAKKTAPKTDMLGALEDELKEVEVKEAMVQHTINARDAEINVLETMRARVWKALGTPFGSVRFGSLRVSRLMVLIGICFFGMLLGSIFVGPVLGLMIVGCIVAFGFLWIRSKLA
jgi:hypothetical protein